MIIHRTEDKNSEIKSQKLKLINLTKWDQGNFINLLLNLIKFLLIISYQRSYGNTIKCESHPEAPLIEDHRAGDMICSQCGLVVGDRLEMQYLNHNF